MLAEYTTESVLNAFDPRLNSRKLLKLAMVSGSVARSLEDRSRTLSLGMLAKLEMWLAGMRLYERFSTSRR